MSSPLQISFTRNPDRRIVVDPPPRSPFPPTGMYHGGRTDATFRRTPANLSASQSRHISESVFSRASEPRPQGDQILIDNIGKTTYYQPSSSRAAVPRTLGTGRHLHDAKRIVSPSADTRGNVLTRILFTLVFSLSFFACRLQSIILAMDTWLTCNSP